MSWKGYLVLISAFSLTANALAGEYANPHKCVALRGNGNFVSAHFGGMARLVEDHGIMTGVAGSSSAALTAFLYDSMLENPAAQSPDAHIRRQSVALMLKSMYGLLDELKDRGLTLLMGEAESPQHRELLQRLQSGRSEAMSAVLAFEFQHGVAHIINRDFIDFAFNYQTPRDFRTEQVLDALQNLGSFNVVNPDPLLRPGPFNFAVFGKLAARLADLYALRNTTEQFPDLLDMWVERCRSKTYGLSWESIKTHRRPDIAHCADDFLSLAHGYLKSRSYRERNGDLKDPRHLDPIGRNIDVLISTGVIAGESAFKHVRDLQQNFYYGNRSPSLGVSYKDLWIGYWGSSNELLARVKDGLNERFALDEKSRKFKSLGGDATWDTVLRYSPAEPGLSEALVIDAAKYLISVGGWSDLHPVQVLKSAGCDEVFYITRQGPESNLAVGMVQLFDDGAEHAAQLFRLSAAVEDNRFPPDVSANQMSSFETALHAAGGVLCTDWNNQKFSGTDVLAVAEESYHAPMVYSGPGYARYVMNRSHQIVDESVGVGCRAGGD